MNDLSRGGFDYSGMRGAVVAELRTAADTIRMLVRRTTADVIETGRHLAAAKGKLPHGKFGGWLQAEFGMTDRTAQRYMAAAEWAEGKSDTVSLLAPAAIYLLSSKSAAPDVQLAVIERLDRGEPVSTETVREMLGQSENGQDDADIVSEDDLASGADSAEVIYLGPSERQIEQEEAAERASRREARAAERADQDRRMQESIRQGVAENARQKAIQDMLIALLRNKLGDDVERFCDLASQCNLGFLNLVAGLLAGDPMAHGEIVRDGRGGVKFVPYERRAEPGASNG